MPLRNTQITQDNKSKEFKRCFLCLDLSRKAIYCIKELQEMIAKKNFFIGKFTESENLHLTLKFLGEIEEEKIEKIKEKLKKIKFRKFVVHLGGLGFFSKSSLKILWIKLNGRDIWNLQKEIDALVEEFGFKLEERFMSHITIARIKKILKKNECLDYVKSIKTKKIEFEVKDFVLKESELKPEGPNYKDLGRYGLDN